MQQTGCRAENVAVYDDNVPNVAEALAAGFDAVWAIWGYSSPEHRRTAEPAAAQHPPRCVRSQSERRCSDHGVSGAAIFSGS